MPHPWPASYTIDLASKKLFTTKPIPTYLIACHFLLGAIGTTGSYTEGSLPMHIIDLNCTGSESRVLDCPHNGLSDVHTCDHRQDASVRCQGTFLYNFYPGTSISSVDTVGITKFNN
jgi:hypothetical protein